VTSTENIADREKEPVLSIAARHGWRALNFGEIWDYRGLIWLFAKRDLTLRYKQTVFGVLWVLLQPLGMTVVYSIFFGRIAHIPSDGVPYPVFVLGGTILWQSFARGLADAGSSLVAQQGLISKIYFARPIVPLSPIISTFFDCGVMLLVLIALMLLYGLTPHWPIFLAPLVVLLTAILAFAISLWLSALDALYRDVRYALIFLVQFWYFATPVIYPLSIVPPRFRLLFGLNPMTAPIEGFRWAVLGNVVPPDARAILCSLMVTAVLLIGGMMFFRRIERSIVDRI
jgi:lipopolysaccharide transport system permease protein